MSIDEIIEQVAAICKKHHVPHLSLFGSYAKGNATKYSDVDFIVYGAKNLVEIEEEIQEILTLKTIDLFDYDACRNEFLKEDMDKYGIKIY